MGLQDPVITQIERTGYPFSGKREEYGVDAHGNEVYQNDEILIFNDEFYLVEALNSDAIEILETHGANYKTAK